MARQTTTSATRNRFFRTKPMGAAEFRTEQDYFLERRWLINRSVHGWGVVAGYKLNGPRKRPEDCDPDDAADKKNQAVTLGAGLAFDRRGRELLLCAPTTLTEKNTFLVDPNHPSETRSLKHAAPGLYVLRAHYAEQAFGDSLAAAQCGCDDIEKSFVCETVIFSVSHLCCDEPCPCAESECEHHCGCCEDSCACGGRGSHGCLCRWIADTSVSCESRALCMWKGFRIDPCDAVPLACITIERSTNPCEPVSVACIDDDCGPRRLVKNNDLLYELARGCDLTRIEWISWGRWHRNPQRMPWPEFRALCGLAPTNEPDHKSVLTKLTVRFSGPVKQDTVTPDCFAVRFVVTHEDTGWSESRVAEIVAVVADAPLSGDPAGTTRQVTLAVDPLWHNEVSAHASKFRREGATVEIDIYGDYILDCNGQSIDANAKGFALREMPDGKTPQPSGNGTPGGTFLSVFRIDPRTQQPALEYRGTTP